MHSTGLVPEPGLTDTLLVQRIFPVCADVYLFECREGQYYGNQYIKIETVPPLTITTTDRNKFLHKFYPWLHEPSFEDHTIEGDTIYSLPGWQWYDNNDGVCVVNHLGSKWTLETKTKNNNLFILQSGGKDEVIIGTYSINSEYTGGRMIPDMEEFHFLKYNEQTDSGTKFSIFINIGEDLDLGNRVSVVHIYEGIIFIPYYPTEDEEENESYYIALNVINVTSVKNVEEDRGTLVKKKGTNFFITGLSKNNKFIQAVNVHRVRDVHRSPLTAGMALDYDRAMNQRLENTLNSHLTRDVAWEVMNILTRTPPPPPNFE